MIRFDICLCTIENLRATHPQFLQKNLVSISFRGIRLLSQIGKIQLEGAGLIGVQIQAPPTQSRASRVNVRLFVTLFKKCKVVSIPDIL